MKYSFQLPFQSPHLHFSERRIVSIMVMYLDGGVVGIRVMVSGWCGGYIRVVGIRVGFRVMGIRVVWWVGIRVVGIRVGFRVMGVRVMVSG